MLWFMIPYLLALLLLNHYVCRRIHWAFGIHGRRAAAMILVGVFLVAAHIMGRVLERQGWHMVASVLSLAGDHWLLILMWFVSLSVPVDAWNLIWRLAARRRAGLARLRIPFSRAVVGIGVAMLALFGWGLKESLDIRVRTVLMETPEWPEGSEVRICQISDLHLGAPLANRRLERVTECVRAADADVLALTGDILDARSGLRARIEPLAALPARLGRFAVLGNHDFYAGADQALELITGAGYRLLREERVEIAKGDARFILAGLDDPAGRFMHQECRYVDVRALPGERRMFTVLLKHQPMLGKGMAGRFTLQLSGHTHGGQCFPFHFLVRMIYPYFSGLYEVDPGQWIHVSRGAGTWGPVARVFSPPEVTVFVIRGAPGASHATACRL